ncbi:MAG TPA: ATP-binding cassette domain-containing protein, partial [Acetobacteraceae bacterium]|nr:ATP-binding cassette domain-containing protein [Acetobacteraceae bacterium]
VADWPAIGRAVLVSVASASVASALVAAGGIPLGFLLARRRGRAAAALGVLVQLPLALPPLASGILLLFLLGPYAPLGRLVGGVTDSFAGIVCAEAFVAAPFLVIAAREGFAGVDPALEDVAATLGHAPGARFLRVSLRLAWPTIRAGLLLTWLRAFGEFGATVMLAYHPYSLPVYTFVAFGADGLPAMLPVLAPTLAAALAVLFLASWRPRARARRSWQPKLPAPRRVASLPSAAAEAQHLAFDVTRRAGRFALACAWAPEGRRLAIIGASGSGKSMTLRLLCGLDPAARGMVRLGGRDLGPLPPERRGIGYVPQSYALLPDRTLRAQLAFPPGADPAAAEAWIGRLDLAGLEDRLPSELSLGQQQRVALARALLRTMTPGVAGPGAGLLLLDEPFSALDAPLRRRLRLLLRGVQAALPGLVTVLVTHDPDEALLLADFLLVLHEGRVLQAGPAASLLARPASAAVARLLGAEFEAPGQMMAPDRIALGGGASLAVAGPALPVGATVGWTVRRGFVALRPDGAYPAEIETAAPVGAGCELVLRLGDARLAALVAGRPAPGPCRIDIPAEAVQVWPAEITTEITAASPGPRP